MDLKKMGCEAVDWIEVRIQFRTVLITEINLVPYGPGNF
jgi:hypothetical protein